MFLEVATVFSVCTLLSLSMSLSSCIHHRYSGKLGALVFLLEPICDITRQSLAQTQETTHTGPPWALKQRWRYIPNPCRVTFPCPPRRRRCSYVWLIRQPLQGPGLLARPHHNPPLPSHCTSSHLNTSPAPQQSVLASMYHLRTVCHVNSVDWSAQQNCFLEGRSLPLSLLLLPPLTYGGLVREWWRLRRAAAPARRAGIFDVPSHRRLVHTGGGCHLYTALSLC